jgi:hypothetical protein
MEEIMLHTRLTSAFNLRHPVVFSTHGHRVEPHG